MTEIQKRELWALIRDAQRYREIRKHRKNGDPELGIPFAMGWNNDEDGKLTGQAIYIREGELDDNLDEVLHNQNIFPDEIYDRLLTSTNETL